MCFFYILSVVLQGSARCEIENHGGVVTLRPLPGCVCLLNEREVTEPCRLAQGQQNKTVCSHRICYVHVAQIGDFVVEGNSKKKVIACFFISDLSLVDMQACNLHVAFIWRIVSLSFLSKLSLVTALMRE